MSLEEKEKLKKEVFRRLGYLGAEIVSTPLLSKERFLRKWVLIPEEEKLRQYFQKGGVFITGHIGNWEWFGKIASYLRGEKIYAFAKRQANYWSNRYIEKTRNQAGIILIYTDESPKRVLRLLKNGEVIGFIADQDAGRSGEFFWFLNRYASTFMGPAYFARVSKAPVYFMWSYRNSEGKLVFHGEELEVPSYDLPPREWEKELTRRWVRRLEEVVKEHPEDYFWLHNRWRTQPSKKDIREKVAG